MNATEPKRGSHAWALIEHRKGRRVQIMQYTPSYDKKDGVSWHDADPKEYGEFTSWRVIDD